MNDANQNMDFDMQTAWLRRFKSDSESNIKAFSLRLKEALPEQVTIYEKKPLLFGTPKITGVRVSLGDYDYTLEIVKGQLKATIAMVVRGITLNTKSIDPAEWFTKLLAETQKATEHAKNLSESLSIFMSS
ncbi:hypothetical protein [Legionella fallonii]|uniref:Uncharacterized protein n=1 Tax=Legionella fallonii LLAP-10 TaxID=1212491 RepID=A0A098G7E7_9GAMM|nr:hypothetical protein [Legionella fallonii]CEG58382.1 conserved protein of unknown function [Legionella fallonii LLAP-10]